ncbi:MAG: ABC transporter substrate-binding protein [Rhodospirillales bacterium]|nr:MAG: ABC transporter substrate-binding protein [Rhodospirillales bacterium]
MRRRLLLSAALSAPSFIGFRAAAAERVIGFVSPEARESMTAIVAAFRAGLADNAKPGAAPIRVVERYADGKLDAVPGIVAQLEKLPVNLIMAQGAATLPVVRAKRTVPVVYGYSGDPVVAGIAQSLARPGGDSTGATFMAIELNPKRVDLVREALPACRRIALLSNARHAGEELEITACERAVAPAGIELVVLRAQTAADIPPALAGALESRVDAVMALPSASMVQATPMIVEACAARGVPLVSGWAQMAHSGALFTYGPELKAAYRGVARHAVRILDGAKPGDLPIERPSVFELVVNQRTAKRLGLTLPSTLLARADEVIE